MPEPDISAPFVVTIADCPLAPGRCDVMVGTPRLELTRLATGQFAPDEPVRVWVPARRLADEPRAWDEYAGRINMLAEPSMCDYLGELGDTLRRLGAACRFAPSAAGDGTAVKEMASLGVPIVLSCEGDWPAAVLDDLLTFFLHSPTLEAPIEPFYSLASAVAERDPTNLWALLDELPGRNYFIDSRGRVSLSSRWAGRGRFFGTVGDDPVRFRETPLWGQVADLKYRLFVSQARCAFCEHYLYCGGFWTTAEDPGLACATWRRLMDRIGQEYQQELDRLRAGHHREHPAENLM